MRTRLAGKDAFAEGFDARLAGFADGLRSDCVMALEPAFTAERVKEVIAR